MIALYIILTLIFLFLLLCAILVFTKLTIVVTVDKKGLNIKLQKFKLSFTVKIGKGKKEEKSGKKKQSEEEKEKEKSEKKAFYKLHNIKNNFIRQKNALSKSLSYLKGRIVLSDISLFGYFGTGNPVSGGIVCGTVYAFFNTVLGFLGNFFNIPSSPHVNVKLKENQAVCDLSGAFLIKAKPYDVIKAIIIYKKTLKKGI